MAGSPSSNNPMAGGFLLALSLIVGVAVGIAAGEASLGFLAGAVVGGAALLVVWLLDRRRTG